MEVSTDNSLGTSTKEHALEVISPILRGEAGLDYIGKVAGELTKNDAFVDPACGLHVHMDLTGIDLDGLKRICQNWIKFEHAVDQFMDPSRRDSKNRFCPNVRQNRELGQVNNESALAKVARKTTLKGLQNVMNADETGKGQRYFKLNLTNLSNQREPRNTLEFRGHHGTCNADEIVAWVRLLNAFINSSVRSHSVQPLSDTVDIEDELDSLFRFINDSGLEKWYRSQKRRFEYW